MSIKLRLLLTGGLMVLLTGLVIFWMSYSTTSKGFKELTGQSSHALIERAKNQLASIRSTKAQHIQDYFQTIVSQAKTFSNDWMIVDACEQFKKNFFQAAEGIDQDRIINMRRELGLNYSGSDYLQNPTFNQYNELVPGYHHRPVDTYIPADNNAVVLQYFYIYKNPNPVGEKHNLNSADANLAYNEVHKKYHPVIRDFLDTFHYYDIFIIDPDTGYIVYTVFKEKDFATSLLSGPYKDTNFARCFREARDAGRRGERNFVSIVDFEPYEPSYNAPASFVASPIFKGDKFIGVLAFQMPIDEINRIMLCDRRWEEIGLGKTGETYLVGFDYKMRSPSRFVEGALMKLTVRTEAVEKALSGQTGVGIIKDYRGEDVLSAWQPLNIQGLKYVLLAEIDAKEALASVKKMKNVAEKEESSMFYSASVTVVVAVVVACGVLFWIVISITNPLGRVVEFASVVASGNLDVSLSGRFPGELASLKDAISTMVANLKERIAEATKLSEQSKEEAQKAKEAMQQAEEAMKKAEAARREGLQEAARKLEKVVDGLVSASEQLSAQAEQVTKGALTQKERTEQTATAMEEMNATVLEVARNASQAAEETDQAKTRAENGAEIVNRAVMAINRINELTEKLKTEMTQLKDKASGISQVMTVISDIADQTNLLALNAAIEAARAGEAGRGFAVVADEVRKLAEKTMDATREVGSAISEIQSEVDKNVKEMNSVASSVEEGTQLAGESHQALQEIVKLVVSVTDQVRAIATASEEQSAASEEINRSVEDIRTISEETARGMKETKDAVDTLVRLAEDLRVLTEELAKG